MSKIQVWMQGFAVTGQSGNAQLLGEYEAKDFDDAVNQYNTEHPDKRSKPPAIKGGLLDGKTMEPIKEWTIWGCILFDNEKDARKSFG